MIEFTTPIPDYPCEISNDVTEEELQKVFSDYLNNQKKRLEDEFGIEYVQRLNDKYNVK